MLRRNVRLILITGAATALLAFGYSSTMTKRYTATTDFLPPQSSNSGSSALLAQLGGLGSLAGLASGGGIKSQSDLYVGLLKSETVEDGMIRRFNLMEQYHAKLMSGARGALEGAVKIDGTGKDGLIRISVTDKSPERAAELANGYVDQYRQLSASLAIGEAAQRRVFLEQQLQQAKNALATAEEDLKRSQQTSGMIQLDSQARALIESVASLRAQISAKDVPVQAMRTYAGAGNPDLMLQQQELDTLHAQLAKLGAKPNGDAASDDLIVSQGRLPQAGLDYVRKTREVKYQETLFEILARQFEAARLDEAREGSMVQVVDRAYPPDKKSWPPRALFLLGGGVLGTLLSSLWIVFRDMMRRMRAAPEWQAKVAEYRR